MALSSPLLEQLDTQLDALTQALLAGAPIFAVLGGLALGLFWSEGQPLASVPLSHYQITVNPSLPALPLFTLAGLVFARSGAAGRLGTLFTACFGSGATGSAVAAAVLCSCFTAFTGGSGVTILALGGLLLGAGMLLGLGSSDGHGGADTAHAHATTGHDAAHHSHQVHHVSGAEHGPGPGQTDHAPDQPIDHGADHDATFLAHVADLLGLGRVPLNISLMLMLLIFGGTGTTVNLALAERLAGGGSALPSILIAVLAVLVLAGPCSRLLGKVAPSIETYPVTRRDLIGCTAILLNDTDEQGGYAQARDREGNVHNITCRTYGAAPAAGEAPGRGPLPKGTQVLIIDFEPASNRYAVEKCPDEPAELAALTHKHPRPRRVATRS